MASVPDIDSPIQQPDHHDEGRHIHGQAQPHPKANADESISLLLRPISSNDDEKKGHITPSCNLRRYRLILRLTILYSILAILAWAITCILVYRPLTTAQYGLKLKEGDEDGYYYPSRSLYMSNERLFQAARVIQAIIAVATIPLTSAVCSIAAVSFVQRERRGDRLSLRKTMVLADRGWTDFEIFVHLLCGRWRVYGSSLLYLAIVLTALGAIISPLQSLFISTRTVQTPASLGHVAQLTDFSDPFDNPDPDNDLLAPAQLRSSLTSTASTDPQIRLWTSTGALNCTNSTDNSSSACSYGQVSLTNITLLEDPFLAQLPAGYNTGLVRQFIPRINSSVKRERIPAEDFPADCLSLENSFYVNYSDIVMTGFNGGERVGISWSLVACMPDDQRQSPWRNTRERQDFSETLFLNLSAYDPSPSKTTWTADQWSGCFKITLNTTAGYFELPNYMNGGLPGPLISDDPSNHCGSDCIMQTNRYFPQSNRRRETLPETNGTTAITDASFALSGVPNKGPLLTMAMALFGAGSFISDRTAHPEAYINQNVTMTSQSCTERAPFVGLLTSGYQDPLRTSGSGEFVRCITNNAWNFGFLQDYIRQYVQTFIGPDVDSYFDTGAPYDMRLDNALEAAAFLSNELWLTAGYDATLTVSYDVGAGTQVPHISQAGIILISMLLGAFLTALLAMAIYGTRDPHWTSRLNSFAMMQFGAAISEHLPFRIAENTRGIEVLDETPGWVGDRRAGEEEVGELGLGALGPMKAKRKYACFECCADHVDESKP